jgi:succinylarginine dihydrolase
VTLAYREFNFDGLVGPTHHYGGLAEGNRASVGHRFQVSHPRTAALQGLEKMRVLAALGVGQAVLPPLNRPRLDLLRWAGFAGSDQQMIDAALRHSQSLLSAAFSASGMWTANAAMFAPSCDSRDGCVHITPANLISNLHRSLEADETAGLLKKVFPDFALFKHHPPLPKTVAFSDEGAANHIRLVGSEGDRGAHLFVYGREYFGSNPLTRYPQRQTLEACQAVARLHQLPEEAVVFACQSPAAIDAGVFHNDVISTGHGALFLYHAEAFADGRSVVDRLKSVFEETQHRSLCAIEINEFSLAESVQSYFFNSQIVTRSDGRLVIVAPAESEENEKVRAVVTSLVKGADAVLADVLFLNLRESMQNGGGPACLRTRVVLNQEEQSAVPPRLFFSEQLFNELTSWVKRHYRETLSLADFRDPALLVEIQIALDKLTQILELGSIYSFQK